MASQDSYFVVRKGLGVGTAALYADGDSRTVAIGKTIARYPLDVVGKVYSNDAIYAQNNIGVGTTSNYQQLDVIGSTYISNKLGVGNTAPEQTVHVGVAATESFVVTGIGSVGVGTNLPRGYRLDVYGDERVSGLVTSAYVYTGIATIGIGSIGVERVGISTVTFANVETEIVGISSIRYLTVTGVTTTAVLDVGIGGTILTADNFEFSTETLVVPERYDTGNKEIIPLVGINTISPSRTLDVAGDIRIQGEVVDAQNNVGYAYSVLASSGDGKLVWNPPGARIGNEWFVNKLGYDDNHGKSPGDAFLTIKKACSVAQPGDTIRVFAGLYVEDGPVQVPERVAIVGEDLRRTLVTTSGPTDLYHIRRGCYISHQSFVGPSNPGKAMISFPTQGYGYADGTDQNWQSPYIQNCTNFVPDSIGMRVDGNRAGGFKSMVLDAYTQYNQNGIGVSITNFGYAQLVSLFTICCDIAVFCDTGGVCDLNNSNSSFGNYALVSNGATPLQYTGTVIESTRDQNTDIVDSLLINVGAGASSEFRDTVDLLRLNKEFIAREAVGFLTSTDGPYFEYGPEFDYGGSKSGRSKCIRDAQIIIETICSDILTLGNGNSINAGLAYRDSEDDSITYLIDSDPPPEGFDPGYVLNGELSMIDYIVDLCDYVAQDLDPPVSYQSGLDAVSRISDPTKDYSPNVSPFIADRAQIIKSIIQNGLGAVPNLILPQGQRPYDGQIAYIGTQYYFISKIVVDNPGSGYDPTIPVEVRIDLPSDSDVFIPAEASVFETDINPDGTIANVSIIASGTGYTETPPQVIISPPAAGGTQATAYAVMEKYFFNPISSTEPDESGNTRVTFDEFITYPVEVGDTVYFYQSSKIIASSITFEYIGTGTDIVQAVPSKGAVPIDDNQIVATNGGKVPFTSTDQSGDFRISEGITINQNTGTISGQAFSKSLQAEVTPLIIALQQ